MQWRNVVLAVWCTLLNGRWWWWWWCDDDDDDTSIIRNFGSHLRLSRRHIPEDLDSLATPLREPEILQNLAALKFEVVRETVRGDPMAGETGCLLLSRGNRTSRPGI
jgi:hypothetical protein